MNQIHRIVFNRSTGIAQAVPEIASSCGGGAGTSTTVGQAKRPRLNRLTTACLSALAAMATLGSVPAWADGGRGGDSVYGADALGGAAGQPSGPNAVGGRGGELFDNGGGGGGGSVNVTGAYVGYGGNGGRGGGTANGADNGGIAGSGGATPLTSGSVAIDISGPIASAGNGGDGQTANTAPDGLDGAFSGGGGGGGGGAFNFTSTADGAQLNNSASLVGGSGGRGGNGDPQLISGSVGGGGGGGEGGGGLLLAGANAVVTSSGPVTGGSGGNGGNGGNGNERAPIFASGGAGGDGGSGIAFSAAGGKLTNTGMLSGGNGGVGGAGGLGQVPTAASGAGGAGVRGADLAVINGGTVSGGLSGDGATRASAVVFTGGTNSYTLLPNSVTTGNVLAFSTADTLGLSGDAVTNGNGTFDVSAIGPAAQYRGFGQFSKTGNNTWTLTGTTTAVTPWSVTGSGTLAVGSDASLGDVSGALSINGATLKATAGFTLARSLLLGNYVNIDTNGFNVTASGLIGMKPFQGIEVDPISYGELHKQGAGTLTITNAGNDYNGGTFVESGTLAVAGTGALGTYAVQVSSGATLDISQATDSALVRFLGGAGTVAIGDKTLVVDNTASGTTFDGVIQDGGIAGGTGGKLLITDAGVNWTLTNAQTFTGGTTLQAGNLFLTGNGAFVAGSALALQGGTLDVSGINASGVVLGDLSGGGNLALGAKSLTVGTANSTTYSGVASGTGGLTKVGDGTLTLAGVNTYSGGTAVNAGTVQTSTTGALGSGPVAVNAGGALLLGGNFNAGDLAITIAPRPTPNGIVNGGFLQFADNASAGTATLNNQGNIEWTGTSTAASATLTNSNGGSTVFYNSSTAGSANIVNANGQTNFFDNSSTGTATVTNQSGGLLDFYDNSTASGATVVNQAGGTVRIRGVSAPGLAIGSLSGAGAVVLGANALTVGGLNTDTTVSGVVSGTGGSLVKTGTGTLTLAGVNTYSGGTAVNAGTVQTSTTGALGSGPVAVNAGGALLLGGNFNAGNLAIGTASRPTPNGDVNGGFLQFADNASAGTATLNNQGNIEWTGTSTAASATLTNSNGGSTVFYNSSTAGSANIVNANGQTNFFDNSSTGTATVTNQSGGLLDFYDNSTASGTTVVNQAGGTVRIRGVGTPGLAIGSLSGAGAVVLGTKALTVGGLNTDTTVSGVISGTGGSLVKTGTGTLTLTGANTYTGGTTVSSGTLSGNAASFGTGAIVDNAALVIDQASDATLANTLSGTGSLTKTGTGQLLYTGNGAGFTGSTLVSGGSLSVNGSLGGTSTIGSGGVLKGTGTIGTTVLAAGATLAPGNSIGTLTVNGDFTFMPGSRYEVEVNAAGQSDLLRVNGTATLGGAAVAVIAATGSYNLTTDYTILSAANRVGTFGSVSSNFAFLDPTLRYAGNDVLLSLRRNDVAFASVGATPNQRAAAAGLQSVGASALYDVVVQSTAATAQSAFNQLSGELHASVKTALLEDSRFVRDAALDRLRSESGNGMSVNEVGNGSATWARVFGSDGHIDGDGNASRLNRDLAGFLVGADTLLANGWRTGALAGYSKSNLDVDGLSSTAKADSYHVGVYGGTQWDATSLRLGASYTWNKLDTQRNIGFTGFANNLKADYDVSTTQIFGEIGQRIDMGTVAVEPFAGLAYVNVDADGFREAGGAAALRSGGGSIDSTFGTLGVRASTQLSETTRLRGTLGWRHAFGERVPTSTNAFATGNAFTVSGVPLAKDVAVLEAGIETQLQKNMTLGLSYAGQFGDGLKDHGFKVSLGWKF